MPKDAHTLYLLGGTDESRAAWNARIAQWNAYRVQRTDTPENIENIDGDAILILQDDGSAFVASLEEETYYASKNAVPSAANRITLSMPDDCLAAILLHVIERSQLKKELESSRRALSEFCHTAAHDLKAPARRIAQFCEILKEESAGTMNKACGDYIDRINVNATRLQNLVGEILAYSQASEPRGERQRTDLNGLLRQVAEELKGTAGLTNATIDIGPLPEVSGYPQALAELFENLLDNALKYRGTEDPVIRIRCEGEDTHYLFSISDNGQGIEEKFHDRIFMPFERLHTQDDVEGSGLGLAICAKIAALHGGKIWLDSSTPGMGSVFKFTLEKD